MAQRTIKLTLEYDGTDFVGWQYQKNGRSVQVVVENALAQILQEQIRVVGAGRTDSGVHARGQVASFRTTSPMNPALIARGLNGVLPDDVVIVKAQEASPDFNARYSAKSRSYEYIIGTQVTALSRKYCWTVGYRLDFELMSQCATRIQGLHDFGSFCKHDSEVDHFRCTVYSATWHQRTSTTIVFEITSDRFLHGMVRALVGTMVEIGRGHRQSDDFVRILQANDRRMAGMTAPPHGLYLARVEY